MSFIIICDKLIFFSSRFGLKHGNLINMLWTGYRKKRYILHKLCTKIFCSTATVDIKFKRQKNMIIAEKNPFQSC